MSYGDVVPLVATCHYVSCLLFITFRLTRETKRRQRINLRTLLQFIARVHILEDRSLRLDNVTMEDVGEYSCEAENAVGVVVATGLLNVVGEYLIF